MACSLCPTRQQSDPNVESNWRYIQLDGQGYYVCPKHFPSDETATREQYRDAYLAVLRALIERRRTHV